MQTILKKNLHMGKICLRSVLHLYTEKQKELCLKSTRELLKKYKNCLVISYLLKRVRAPGCICLSHREGLITIETKRSSTPMFRHCQENHQYEKNMNDVISFI